MEDLNVMEKSHSWHYFRSWKEYTCQSVITAVQSLSMLCHSRNNFHIRRQFEVSFAAILNKLNVLTSTVYVCARKIAY